MRILSIRMTATSTAIAAAIGCLASLQYWFNSAVEGNQFPLGAVLARHIPSWLTWGLVAPLILAASERWPLRGQAWRANLARHVVMSLLFALVHRPLHVWFAWYPFWGNGPSWDFVRDFTSFSLFTDVAIYLGIVAAKTVFDQRELIRRRDLQAARLSGELAETKLTVLEQQLRPHFLFNTLHALQVLQGDGKMAEASTVVDHLAELLRAVLRRDAPAEVPLRDELRLAEPYLALMSVRYGDRLEVRTNVDTEALDVLVPRLILQPLLENAFLHGIDGRRDAGTVSVAAHLEEHGLVLEVADDGPGPAGSSRQGSGMGLANVRSRVAARFGSKGSFELCAGSNGGAVARLRMPRRIELGDLEVAT